MYIICKQFAEKDIDFVSVQPDVATRRNTLASKAEHRLPSCFLLYSNMDMHYLRVYFIATQPSSNNITCIQHMQNQK